MNVHDLQKELNNFFEEEEPEKEEEITSQDVPQEDDEDAYSDSDKQATISIRSFEIEYQAISSNPDDEGSAVISNESVQSTRGYNLKRFTKILGKTIAEKQDGAIKIEFRLDDLKREIRNYNIEINYVHSRDQGIPFFEIKSKGKYRRYNVNKLIIDDSNSGLKEKLARSLGSPSKTYPPKVFWKLLITIFISIKSILMTENYKIKPSQLELNQLDKRDFKKLKAIKES